MTRHIAIIDGHPDPDRTRFIHALADAYAAGAEEAGHDVARIDLSTLDFPLLRSRAQWTNGAPPPAIAKAQAAISAADHLVILYPLWLGDVPALLKAFFEQIARPGFAIGEGRMPKPLLKGKSARVIVTMGMPAFFYRFYYGAHSVKSLKRNILKLAGIAPVHDTLIGNVESEDCDRADWLDRMGALGSEGA
ncbi:NAD(P)H-dependent oxidoreductase [Stakelama tenebrarum]|uniref:Flavodoxin family protein n=1 Tax=Stakelama tenebrarum TaxID=2711215 RepID=A0A6G6Y8G1_9SPHN|nr:NAD(P)H-dependent oxidoreductase [Sphingosinithalassobacter tenebrarum]QIG81215.1 flavodoxin family protein [Sphingosinithalassobacter tenebrarum]